MPLKLVAYDIAGTDGEYSALERALLGFSLCQKVQPSVWMVHSAKDAHTLRSELSTLVDEADNLMVAEISDWAASGRDFQGASIRRSPQAA